MITKVYISSTDIFQTFASENYFDYGGDYYNIPTELYERYKKAQKELYKIQCELDSFATNNCLIEEV